MYHENFINLGVDHLQQRVWNKPETAPVVTLGTCLIEAGRSGMQAYFDSLKAPGRSITFDDTFWNKLYENCPNEYGAFNLGVGLIEVNKMLMDRRFSFDEFCQLRTSNATGLSFLKVKPINPGQVEGFTFQQWSELLELARRDPSHVSFFSEENINLLPKLFSDNLSSRGRLFHMRLVAPAVSEISSNLIPQLPLEIEEIQRRQQVLETGDSAIADALKNIDRLKTNVLKSVLEREAIELRVGQVMILRNEATPIQEANEVGSFKLQTELA